MEQTTLYYRQGGSDKVYQATIETKDDGFVVNFAFGRRGSTLQTGTKTNTPVPYEKAKPIFNRLITEKKSKGYTPGEDGTPYQHTDKENQATGIQCQLLNAIDEKDIPVLIADPAYWMQPKYDGRRVLLQRSGETISGINRQGLRVSLPQTLVESAASSTVDFIIDGEAIGDVLHVFDVLRIGDEVLMSQPYLERYLRLLCLLGSFQTPHIELVKTACVEVEKQRMFDWLKEADREGVVFKKIDAPYTAGRPASGGPQLKFKFCETASFLVERLNEKRSVALALYGPEGKVSAGNVTIPPSYALPNVGNVVDVKFLHAFRESGKIYQPVYLGVRDDIPPEDCTVDHLKYKDGTEAA